MSDLDTPLTVAAARQSFLEKYDINSNILESSKFIFVAHTTPYLNFFAQGVTLPSVSGQEVLQETPLSTVYRAGDKIMYELLAVQFLIDEDLKVWEELHNWIRGYTFPVNFNEYKVQKTKGIYADMDILFLKNSYESNLSMRFRNVFPTSVGPLTMSSDTGPENVMTTEVTFRYDYFDIIRGSA